MEATMKAVRLHGVEDLRLDDLPVPTVNAGQVKVAYKRNYLHRDFVLTTL